MACFLLEGLSNKEIAAKLDLAPRTVENHVRAILKKADVENRTKFALAFQKVG